MRYFHEKTYILKRMLDFRPLSYDIVAVGLEQEVLESNCRKFKGTFVLRVCGLDEYFLEQKPISQYKV